MDDQTPKQPSTDPGAPEAGPTADDAAAHLLQTREQELRMAELRLMHERLRASESSLPVVVHAARAVADLLLGRPQLFSLPEFPIGPAVARKSLEEEKTALVKELLAAGIEPTVFDALLSSEMDRRLKVRFGVAFLFLTVLVTGASYAIVVLNAIYGWKVSDMAITALVIETPIQFVGLLYVIARNLFPDSKTAPTK